MKRSLISTSTSLLLLTCLAHSQGFIYDQQSSTNETSFVLGEGAGAIQALSPLGQSFTPSLSEVNFVRLSFADLFLSNDIGATLSVNLRTNTISDTILATSSSVTLPDDFSGFVNFFFPSNVVVAPGATYTFEVNIQPGSDRWLFSANGYYTGGSAYFNGKPTAYDLWFREGVYTVPEPSAAHLALLGSAIFLCLRRKLRCDKFDSVR